MRRFCVALILGIVLFCAAIINASPAQAAAGPVVIDPGHGADEMGCQHNGLIEKDLNWKLANYCAAYLQEWGIPVYFTRYENENPSLEERVSYVTSQNARCIVSFHCNAAPDVTGSRQGAEVYIANASRYNSFTHDEGQRFADDLLNRLQSLGLANRGAQTRDLTSSSYCDGTPKDYMAINRLARQRGTTGVLIEHGYIDNAQEAEKFKDDTFLHQVAYEDAYAIWDVWSNAYTKPQAAHNQGWHKNDEGWWYVDYNGSYPQNQWTVINGHWYHFNGAGYMDTGWYWDGATWFYLGDAGDGSMKEGWQFINGSWYYLVPGWGGMLWGGWHWINNCWYYMNPSGDMHEAGWHWIDDAWYFLNPAGDMRKGWYWDGSVWYFLNDSGHMLSNGWYWIGDAWYHLNYSGDAAKGWLLDGSTWYWLDLNSCAMAKSGVYSCWGVPSLFNESGAWLSGTAWYTVAGKTYYVENNVVREGGDWQFINGNWYFVTADGSLKKGWVGSDASGWYYCSNTDGHMLTDMWIDSAGNNCNTQNTQNRKYYLEPSSGRLSYTRSTTTPVMAAPSLSKEQFVALYANKIKVNYPGIYVTNPAYGATSPEAFAELLWDSATYEGVDPVVMGAQIALETGWVGFIGSAVPASACNFGGIDAYDYDTTQYHVYPNISAGLAAQAEYLKCYASNEPIRRDPPADKRAQTVKRAVSPYVECFGSGIYATDPKYCIKLLSIINTIKAG